MNFITSYVDALIEKQGKTSDLNSNEVDFDRNELAKTNNERSKLFCFGFTFFLDTMGD